MKKFLILFLCFSILQTTAFAYYGAESDILPPDEPIDVPYNITYFFFTNSLFKTDSLHDLERLLDLSYQSKKRTIDIFPNQEIWDDTLSMITDFTNNHTNQCTKSATITEYDTYIHVFIPWTVYDYDTLEVLSSAEDVYEAVKECKTHPRYDKIYRIADGYLSYDTWRESRLDTVIADVQEKYGEDITKYLLHSTYFHDYNDYYTEYIYVSIGVKSHLKQKRIDEGKEAYERYNRILKNNVLIPITDDMTELEKIAVIQDSVVLTLKKYRVTNILNDEVTFSLGIGQCMHHADVFKALCDAYGIECMVANGMVDWYKDGEGHAWNCVKYNGNWYMYEPQNAGKTDRYDLTIDNLGAYLTDVETFKSRGYSWDEEEYPECTGEKVSKTEEEQLFYLTDLPKTVKKYEMFEPYYAPDPVAGKNHRIFYYIYFDPTIGKLYAVDSTLSSDQFTKDENDKWVHKEFIYEIPSEIDGVKVKSIDKNFCKYISDNDAPSGRTMYGSDTLIIPDGIYLEDNSLGEYGCGKLIIGDNVTAGYSAMPRADKIESIGENFLYKGDYRSISDSVGEAEIEYVDKYGLDGIIFHYSEEPIVSNYSCTHLYYGGYAHNIVDRAPDKTFCIDQDAVYVDPRLNRLNRKYIVPWDNPNYTAVDGVLYSKDMTKLISVPIGMEEIEIPETVKEIGEYAFSYCNALERIIIPKSVETFGNRAFYHITKLKEVIFEGEIPDAFEPKLCDEFDLFSMENSNKILLDYEIDGLYINILNAPANSRTFAVFYGADGNIAEVIEGTYIKIPPYAKNYELYSWDENMKPLSFKEQGEL